MKIIIYYFKDSDIGLIIAEALEDLVENARCWSMFTPALYPLARGRQAGTTEGRQRAGEPFHSLFRL